MGRKYRNRRGKKAPKRKSRTKIEAKVAQLLDCMEIPYTQNQSVGKYNVDFLIKECYIVECYGDFWHCNPQKYDADYYNRGLKCEAQRKWKKDNKRQQELESMGYKMLVLWESHINNSPKFCKLQIRSLMGGPNNGNNSSGSEKPG